MKYAAAKPLDKPLMAWFFSKYLRSAADGKNPLISLVNANLKGLPSTTIIAAEIDPLLTEGKLLDDKLKAAGVSSAYQPIKRYGLYLWVIQLLSLGSL
jgi:acetyl esterase/lipase